MLADCPIVATAVSGVNVLGTLDVAGPVSLPSGTAPIRVLEKTGWPVIGESPSREREATAPDEDRSVFARLRLANSARAPELPSLLNSGFRREDLPARACPSCQFPLPRAIDDRDALVIAVVGVNRVGKTHFIAASLTEAYRRRGLAALGCDEFVPDEATSTRFMSDYYEKLFRQDSVLEATHDNDDIRFNPLVFNVTLAGVPPFSLIIHDVSGEALSDFRRRASVATFLRAARGIYLCR